MSIEMTGGCLCGAVRYTVQGAPVMAGHCYCVDCRKASGTSHCTHAMFPDAAVSIAGDTRSYESDADSGNRIARHFCPECGSAIFSLNTGMPGITAIRASSLDEPSRVAPQMSVYASRAPQWALLDRDMPIFAEMPEGGPAAVIASD